jgi:CHRD domain/PEP-CTERM motif
MKKIIPAVVVACSLASAHASLFQYTVSLDGPTEGTASPGIGSGTVNYDDFSHTLQLQVSFSGLLSPTSASHIHAATANPFTGTAGVATQTPSFVGFQLGVTSGSFSNTLDLTLSGSWNGSYITANGGTPATAEAALAAAMASGRAYWNIHTSAFPGGEIRGFLIAVPEPASLALAGLGVLGLALRRWTRKS